MKDYSNKEYALEVLAIVQVINDRVGEAISDAYPKSSSDEEFREALNGITDKFWQLRELYKQGEENE